MQYTFLIPSKTNKRLAAIQDAASIYGLYPYDVMELDSKDNVKQNAKYYRGLLDNINKNCPEGTIIGCGIDAIRMLMDDYDAKINKYRRFQGMIASLPNHNIILTVDSEDDRAGFLKDLNCRDYWKENFPEDVWVLDIETNGLNPWAEGAEITRVGVNGISYTFEQFKKWFENQYHKPSIIGHNLKFDLLWLKVFHYDLFSFCDLEIYDTMVAEHLIDENRDKALEDLIFRYTDISNYWYYVDGNNMSELDDCELSDYNIKDTIATYKIYKRQRNFIKDNKLFEFEMQKLKNLLEIEFNGMKIDANLLNEKSNLMRSDIERINRELHLEYPSMNFNSGPQLRRYLYEEKKYPVINYTEKGNASVDNEVLGELSKTFPNDRLLSLLSEFRQKNKILSTYYENIRDFTDSSGLLHGHFNQAQVVTGRLSSGGGINFQNIPARNKEAVETLFISRWKDGKIIKIDYSQLELRVLAELSRDDNMLNAFNNDIDLHTKTSELLGIDRQKAKTMNFRIVYGGGTREETDAWFRAYPKAKEWIDRQVMQYYRTSFTQALTGRIRHLPPPPKGNWKECKHLERQAVNSIIQGLASDITQMAINSLVHDNIIINTVHDSILIDVRGEDLSPQLIHDLKVECEEYPKIFMKNNFGYKWETPLKVVIEVGKSWGSCEEYKGE